MNTSKVVPIGLMAGMEDRLKAALTGMPIAVSWNRIDNGHVEFMNRQFTRLFGYSTEDVNDVYELIRRLFADPEQASRSNEVLQRLTSRGIVKEVTFPPVDIEIVRKDGTRLFTTFSGVILPDANMCLATFVDITEAKMTLDRLAVLANQDELTGLVNRRAFDFELAKTISQSAPNQPFGLLVMDLDDLKRINDTYGHATGDMVLKHFASLMRETFRASDCVSRWGGDEFAVLVRHPTSPDDVRTAAARFQQAVREYPFIIEDGPKIVIGTSVGMSYYPDGAAAMMGLYNIADDRMYDEKRRRKAACGYG